MIIFSIIFIIIVLHGATGDVSNEIARDQTLKEVLINHFGKFTLNKVERELVCKVEEKYIVYDCQKKIKEEIEVFKNLSKFECENLHNTRKYYLKNSGSVVNYTIRVDKENFHWSDFIIEHKNCETSVFFDPKGKFLIKSVAVFAEVSISIPQPNSFCSRFQCYELKLTIGEVTITYFILFFLFCSLISSSFRLIMRIRFLKTKKVKRNIFKWIYSVIFDVDLYKTMDRLESLADHTKNLLELI